MFNLSAGHFLGLNYVMIKPKKKFKYFWYIKNQSRKNVPDRTFKNDVHRSF